MSGDEIISDTWDLKEIEDAVYEVDCKKVTRGGLDNISVFHFGLWGEEYEEERRRISHHQLLTQKLIRVDILLTDIGANASAEEADEGLEDSAKQVIDIVDGFRLNFLGDEESGKRAFATKKEYLTQLKGEFWSTQILKTPVISPSIPIITS